MYIKSPNVLPTRILIDHLFANKEIIQVDDKYYVNNDNIIEVYKSLPVNKIRKQLRPSNYFVINL